MSTIDPVDDNPFRRPPGGASAGANPVPNTPAHSADAVSMFQASNLQGRACRSTDQVANLCGYLCSGIALELHQLG